MSGKPLVLWRVLATTLSATLIVVALVACAKPSPTATLEPTMTPNLEVTKRYRLQGNQLVEL